MEFEAIDVDAIDVATDVTVELSVVDSRAVTSVVDAKTARRAVVNALGAAGRVVSTSEVYVISIEDVAYRARIAEVNTLCEEEKATAIAYHCFRARVGMETTFFSGSSDNRLHIKRRSAAESDRRVAKLFTCTRATARYFTSTDVFFALASL